MAPFGRALLSIRTWSRFCAGRRALCDGPNAASGWKLYGALCLQRRPLLAQPPSPEEEEMAELTQQIEVEKSLYSDHELRCFAEDEFLRQRSKEKYDISEKIVLVQDIEDAWEQKFQKFKPAPRITEADQKNDRTSLNRKLDQNLLLLVKQKFGDEDIWLLPQTEWQQGETLRDTVERVLVTLPGVQTQARFLGNAPCGFYKFKFPKAIRTETNTGGKVFFFKAFLEGSPQLSSKEKADYLWVSKGELEDYLKPAYHSQVSQFLVDI
ncbi:large ribosomal subunit protein mL46 [Pantherophis guttatus]|uniref:Large ribosomal subunit protein mL46 n=1 Tax=Pantherophis guttatus TaxID=94885 RepID=A0A6P9C8T5_PANGU|nr:large ribosomal subunit protein mL46 [Pantherophis guttatus]